MLYLKAYHHGLTNCINVLGRQFIIDKWLPNNLELAKLKCREYLEGNLTCILVEFSDRFGLYIDAEIADLIDAIEK